MDTRRRDLLRCLAAVVPVGLGGCVFDESGAVDASGGGGASSGANPLGAGAAGGTASAGSGSTGSGSTSSTNAGAPTQTPTSASRAPVPVPPAPSSVTWRTTPPPASGVPVWAARIAVGSWGYVPESLYLNGAAWRYMQIRYFESGVMRGSQKGIGAYSGGVLNPIGAYTKDGVWLPGPVYVRWGGGHFATDCNAVVGLHLNTDVPQWYILQEPRAPGLGTPDDASYSADDRYFVDPTTKEPIAQHTYDHCQFDPASNRMVTPLSIAAGMLGRHGAYASAYQFGVAATSGRWQSLAERHSTLSYTPWIQLSFIRPESNTCYFTDYLGTIRRRKLDLISNSVQIISDNCASDRITGSKEGLTSAFDPGTDIALYTAEGTDRIYAISSRDFESPGAAPVDVSAVLTGSGIPAGAASEMNSIVHDPVESCWYYWTNAEPANFRRLSPPSGSYRAGNWNSALVTPVNSIDALAADALGDTQHMYNALRFVQFGAVRGLLLCRSLADPVRFFRLA